MTDSVIKDSDIRKRLEEYGIVKCGMIVNDKKEV